MSFEISITGWTSDRFGVRLPICEILSDINIIDARMETTGVPGHIIDVTRLLNSRYALSRILWSGARIHADIGNIKIYLNNYGNYIGCFFSSIKSSFIVNGIRSQNTQGIENIFLRLDDGEVFHVS